MKTAMLVKEQRYTIDEVWRISDAGALENSFVGLAGSLHGAPARPSFRLRAADIFAYA